VMFRYLWCPPFVHVQNKSKCRQTSVKALEISTELAKRTACGCESNIGCAEECGYILHFALGVCTIFTMYGEFGGALDRSGNDSSLEVLVSRSIA